MAILVDWKIKNRTGVCCHTNRTFEEDEEFYTCIFDDPESDGFIRRDFCVEAWKEVSGVLETKPFSFWKSTYKAPNTGKKEEPIQQNSIEAMLHRMIEEGRSETENARYILALMLERKKLLIPTEVKETENNTLLFYEHKDSGAVYIVADPKLHLEQVGEIQEEVALLLEAEEQKGKPAEETDAETTDESGDLVSGSNDDTDQPDGSDADQDGEQTTETEDDSAGASS